MKLLLQSSQVVTSKSILPVLLLFSLCLMTAAPSTAQAQHAARTKSVREDMDAVYRAFRELQRYLFNREAFLADENGPTIAAILDTLQRRFQHVGLRPISDDPGFAATLTTLQDLLSDSQRRFAEGNKKYALWRLRQSANYCITCHTRQAIKVDFYDQDPGLASLTTLERGDFYMATRQFDRARSTYLQALKDAPGPFQRREALQKWVIIETRVNPNPLKAIATLTHLRSTIHFTPHEDEEIAAWLGSFRRWSNEGTLHIDSVLKAKNLIAQGTALNEPALKGGAVELLRATAILHHVLEATTGNDLTSHAQELLMLGNAYHQLSPFFISELPELFLERAIREAPNSATAQEAYRLYQDIVTLGYTGSSGVRVPLDVLVKLNSLHDLAYGIKQSSAAR